MLELSESAGLLALAAYDDDPSSSGATAPVGPMGRGSCRQALRSAVHEVHEGLHLARPFADIAAGTISRPAYADLLRRLLRFHRCSEPALRRGHARLAAVAFHDRSSLLLADLASLRAEAGGLPSPDLPAACDDEAVGMVYAVEGSLLGGRVIHRQLDGLFGDGTAGRSFFGTKPEPPDRWRRVCAALEAQGSDGPRLERMCRGALRSFTLMEDCLSN